MRGGFRSTGANYQRYNRGFATNNRFASYSRANGWNNGASFNPNRGVATANRNGFNGNRNGLNARNRTGVTNANRFTSDRAGRNRTGLNTNRSGINTATTNLNRFDRNNNRLASRWNGTNRLRGDGFNRNWNHGHNHHHHGCDDFFFFGGFGFPFFSTWDYFYPSAYYPYYPYTPYYYDPYTAIPYGSGGTAVYDDGSYAGDQGYADPGANGGQYDNRGGYHGGDDHSIVSRVQERLAQDGYYKGAIDGVKGSRTYYAIRSYQREHNLPADGEINDRLLEQMGIR